MLGATAHRLSKIASSRTNTHFLRIRDGLSQPGDLVLEQFFPHALVRKALNIQMPPAKRTVRVISAMQRERHADHPIARSDCCLFCESDFHRLEIPAACGFDTMNSMSSV